MVKDVGRTMACLGVHFALTLQEEAALLRARSDNDVLRVVQEQIEQEWDEARLCESDKAWDAIHRCLVGGPLADDGSVLSKCVLGGRQLHQGEDYILSYVSADEVAQVAAALDSIDKPQMLARYGQIGQHGYDGHVGEDDFEYTWSYFDSLREFYRDAARLGRPVLFSVDQ